MTSVGDTDASPDLDRRPEVAVGRPRGARRGLRPGVVAALMLLGLVVVAALLMTVATVFLQTRAGQRVDESVLTSAALGRARLVALVQRTLSAISVVQVVAAAGVIGVIGLLRRRVTVAAAGVALVVVSLGVVEVLKRAVLHRADYGLTDTPGNSLPSGHTVIAVSVALAVVLVIPPRVRPGVALLGAFYAFVTGVATLSAGWHRPSDVVASCLVALGVGLALAAWLTLSGSAGWVEPSDPADPGDPTVAPARRADLRVSRLLGLLALAAGLVAALLAPGLAATTAAGRAGQLLAYFCGVCAIGAATLGTVAVWLPVAAAATGGSRRR